MDAFFKQQEPLFQRSPSFCPSLLPLHRSPLITGREEHTSSGRVWDDGYQSPHCPTLSLPHQGAGASRNSSIGQHKWSVSEKNDKSSLYPGLSNPRCMISSSGASGSWGSRYSQGTPQSPDAVPSMVWPIYSAGQQHCDHERTFVILLLNITCLGRTLHS